VLRQLVSVKSDSTLRRRIVSKNVIIGVLLLFTGVLIGMNLPALSAQQRDGRRGPALMPTLDQLSQDMTALRRSASVSSRRPA